MNVRTTQAAARNNGHQVRRALNKNVRTVKTAAQVGIVAVTGFISGFLGGAEPAKPVRKARRTKR